MTARLKILFKWAIAFLMVAAFSLMSAAFSYSHPAASGESVGSGKRAKNVIMIQTDHELSYLHGAENDTFKIKRPSFDKFRAQGVDFVNAKSINPLCSPARRTMLTGLYPHQHGIITNKTWLAPNPDNDTVYDVLLQNGFDNNNIYFFGKTHYSGAVEANDTPVYTYGATGWADTGYGQPYKQQAYKDYLRRNNYFGSSYTSPVMTLQATPLVPNAQLHAGDRFDVGTMGIITGNYFGILNTPKEFHEAYFLADMVNTQLKEIAASSKRDEPFMMSVNFWGPHHPYYPTAEFADMYRDSNGVLGGDIAEYPSFADDLSGKPKVYAWDNSTNSNPNLAVPNTKTWEEFRTYMALAYAQTTMIDDAIGTIIDTIDSLGFDDDTVVIWTNDHGDALGSHGGHADKECYMTEEIVSINMAVRSPDLAEYAGTDNYSFVNTADVPVTMLNVMGYEFPKHVVGVDLISLIMGETAPREYMVCETNGHFSDTRARSVYYENFKYTYYLNDVDELYDLENDPFELNNLIGRPEMQGRIALMKRMLREWQIEEEDIVPLVNL